MIYSVWNQGAGAFDYFESPRGQDKLNVERPRHLVSRALGATPDQAAWPLPGDVRKIGSGIEPIGRVASARRVGALGAFSDRSLVTTVMLIASAFLAWKYLGPKARRA